MGTRILPASKQPFTLGNRLRLTYGLINALGGDYYGSDRPICKGGDLREHISRFFEGWKTLAVDKDLTPREVCSVIKMREDELNLIIEAVREKKEPSQVYKEKVRSTRDNFHVGRSKRISSPQKRICRPCTDQLRPLWSRRPYSIQRWACRSPRARRIGKECAASRDSIRNQCICRPFPPRLLHIRTRSYPPTEASWNHQI